MAAGMQMAGASPTPFAMSPWPYSFVGERDVVRMLLVGDLGRGKPGWIVPDRLRPLLAHEDPCKTEEVPRHGVSVQELTRWDLENLIVAGAKLVADGTVFRGGLRVSVDVLAEAVEVDADAGVAVVAVEVDVDAGASERLAELDIVLPPPA